MDRMKLELTNEEAAAFKEICNRAVLHSGLQVAEAAVILCKKVDMAAQEEQTALMVSANAAKTEVPKTG
jgi:hypothetical protein